LLAEDHGVVVHFDDGAGNNDGDEDNLASLGFSFDEDGGGADDPFGYEAFDNYRLD
jgi:hypothetical protein